MARSESALPVDSGFDVGGSAILVGQHLLDTGNLILGRNDKGNHACAVAGHHGGEMGGL